MGQANHGHHSHHDHAASKNLRLAFLLNLGFTILELIGGYMVNSVAIFSDAIHDLGDSLALGTAWYLEKKTHKQANKDFSFGYARFSLLGALINSVILIGGSIFVIHEAIQRFIHPEVSNATGMLLFALLGIVVNGYAAFKVSRGKTLNEKVVSWHLMEDVLGWVAVLIVAVTLQFVDWYFLDPALSVLITLYILYGVIGRLRETLYVFLQGAPKEINQHEIEERLLALPHVLSIHHTHVWSLEGEQHVFSTHVRLKAIHNLSQITETKQSIKLIIQDYPFVHFTIETELEDEKCDLT